MSRVLGLPMFLLVALVSLSVLLLPCKGVEIYVSDSKGSNCSDHSPCKTLDEYANDTEIFRGSVHMYFLAESDGVHVLTMDLIIDQAEGILMRSGLPGPKQLRMPETQSINIADTNTIQLLDGDIILVSLQAVALLDLKITGVTGHGLALKDTQGVLLRNAQIQRSSFVYTHSITSGSQAATFTIRNSLFQESDGPGFHVSDGRIFGDLTIDIENTSFLSNQQGGLVMDTSTTLLVHISNSKIEGNEIKSDGRGYAAALSVDSISLSDSTVSLVDVEFTQNQDLRGQPIQSIVYVSKVDEVLLSKCSFQHNQGTAIRVNEIRSGVRVEGVGRTEFINNTATHGGAISLISTQLLFMPGANVLFQDNNVYDVGGAIHVNSPSTIFEANDPNTRSKCFYQFPEWEDSRFGYNIEFINNSATNGGNHIYGASLKSYCVVYINASNETPYLRSNDPQVQALFHFEGGENSPISSTPSRVCVIDPLTTSNFSESCAEESLIFMYKDVYPGEEFELRLILVGAEFGSVTGDVFAQFLSINDDKPTLRSQFLCSRRINELHTPKLFNYSVFSEYSEEILVLTAHHGNISEYSDVEDIRKAIAEYKNNGTIPNSLLTTPVFVNLTLLPCPSGFYLPDNCEHETCKCTCNPNICNSRNQNKGELFNGNANLHLNDNSWVKVEDDNIILLHNCPFDYCKPSSTVNLNDSDMQCAMNHSGTICGQCRDGYSIVLGSNECQECPGYLRIVLIVAFAAAGIVLVFFIKILNMTVSQGTINGLIFYANIVWAYQNIFFSESHIDGVNYRFLKVFIAWINLDLGIVTCFFNALTPYAKIWLQFLFPIYVWSIAGAMIIVANCSVRITRLLGNNLIQVLATLFLLSYAKLLRTVVITLVPAPLLVYNSTEVNTTYPKEVLYVWAFDGNLDYGHLPHLILLVVSLLVLLFLWFPYILILLFIQPLRKYSGCFCLRWINRWKPLFDAYTGPLNPRNHFWIGLLLLARVILLLIFALSYASNPSISLLSLVIMMALLLTVLSYTGQLYGAPTKNSSKFFSVKISFRSILEVSFLLNLMVLGGCVLYTDTEIADGTKARLRSVIVYTSVGISFLEFIGIVLYHVFCAVKSCCRKHTLKFNEYQNLEESHSDGNVDRNAVHVSNADHKLYQRFPVRERLLTDGESTT